jgi:hypothetical protein
MEAYPGAIEVQHGGYPGAVKIYHGGLSWSSTGFSREAHPGAGEENILWWLTLEHIQLN